MQVIAIIRDIFQILFFIAVPLIALKGLYTWKRELLGKSKYELSKNILISLYKVRDEISNCQLDSYLYANRYSYSERKKENNETVNESAILNSEYYYGERYKRIRAEINKMREYQVEAEASFEKKISDSIELLYKVVGSFGWAIRIYHGLQLEAAQLRPLDEYSGPGKLDSEM